MAQMISVTTITSSAGAASYHDAALAKDGQAIDKGADNYYANESTQLTWQGEGAELLGIQGKEVDRQDFIDFLDGKITNPANGVLQDLSDNSKGAERRLGYDFTVSAPKSVSIVGLVGGDQKVIDAHNKANAMALAWLEKHGSQIRVKDENGNNKVETTGNLLYATVQHETSRANDPQLHNHNVIVGVTYDTEREKWRSLTNDELFVIRATGDAIYKNELAQGLKAAGYQLDYGVNGRDFEIRGITKEQLEKFSERSAQIDEALRQRGIDPANASHAARQTAALDSRAAKGDIPKNVLHEIWAEKAQESGMSIEKIVSQAANAVPERTGATAARANLDAQFAVDRAVSHLSERQQSFKVSELEATAVYFGGGKFGLGNVEAAIKDRQNEKVLVDRTNAKTRMLTTSVAINQELSLQDSIKNGQGEGLQVMTDPKEFDAALLSFEARKSIETNSTYKLTDEQVNAARNVLMHPDKFQGIQGDAGTGKTAALEFVKEAALAKGWEIAAIATTSSATKELQRATGIESSTAAAFLQKHDNQIKMLKGDLDKLTINIANSSSHLSRIEQIERRDLNLKGKVGSFGTARYVFDNKTGEVFKSNTGPLNPLNVLGQKLTDAGNRLTTDAKKEWEQAESFGTRFKAGARLASGSLQATLGKNLATYETVGKIEADAARYEARTQSARKNI
jgi:conjugative relaxase-like TrwC/TraI family protein